MPEKKKQEPKVKLKQVHWVKVNDRKIKDTVWEKMKDDEVDIDVPPARLLLQRYGPVRSACVLTWPSAD